MVNDAIGQSVEVGDRVSVASASRSGRTVQKIGTVTKIIRSQYIEQTYDYKQGKYVEGKKIDRTSVMFKPDGKRPRYCARLERMIKLPSNATTHTQV